MMLSSSLLISTVFPESSSPNTTILAFFLIIPQLERVDFIQLYAHICLQLHVQVYTLLRYQNLIYYMQLNVPNPPVNPVQKPPVLQYKKVYQLIDSNRDAIRKLPQLLLRHLQIYQKAHLDESAEIYKTLDDGNFLEELSNFKSVSFEFAQQLTLIKKNFTTLLTREQESLNSFEHKKASNFQLFSAQHCEYVAKKYIEQIGTINTQLTPSKIQN